MLYFYHINILFKEKKYILIYSYLNRENYQLITEESKKNDMPSIVSTGYFFAFSFPITNVLE